MAALFFQIICYFDEPGKGGLEVFDDLGGDDVRFFAISAFQHFRFQLSRLSIIRSDPGLDRSPLLWRKSRL